MWVPKELPVMPCTTALWLGEGGPAHTDPLSSGQDVKWTQQHPQADWFAGRGCYRQQSLLTSTANVAKAVYTMNTSTDCRLQPPPANQAAPKYCWVHSTSCHFTQPWCRGVVCFPWNALAVFCPAGCNQLNNKDFRFLKIFHLVLSLTYWVNVLS